jgi:hypothetical protein
VVGVVSLRRRVALRVAAAVARVFMCSCVWRLDDRLSPWDQVVPGQCVLFWPLEGYACATSCPTCKGTGISTRHARRVLVAASMVQ